ncbi:poly-gamma-glutamate hydrolase family protein [Microtetraspora malaysiensis]|uniref:poly-gamma-glutamate hydrolase family protein n=1 Tax=Microtetraspora malaysiensis TaxID=161358 RepID=UPI003D8A338E
MRKALFVIAANALVLTLCGTAQAASAKRADTYPNFRQLAAHEVEGKDFRRVQQFPPGARVAHIAIHGGAIEAPTTQLANAAAGSKYAFYSFEGLKSSDNRQLHITATHFDEPKALKLVAAVDYTVSWHAAAGGNATTYVGGRDKGLVRKVSAELRAAGFTVAASVPGEIAGVSPLNIANKNRRGMGVQLEISRGQRERFFVGGKLGRAWVENPAHRTEAFNQYVAAVNRALS